MSILRSAAAAAALLVVASAASAAGLGRLTVNSALGQILNAEIDLVSLQPGEADALSVRVAPPEAFQDARIEYSGALRLLRFSVEKRASGQSYLKVTSIAPINEPFIDVLIEMSWPSGRIQREYPILLDPPGYAQGRVPPLVQAAPAPRIAETPPAATPAAPSSTPSAPETATVTTATPSASAEMPSGTVSEPASDTYGPIQKGETLSKIAGGVKPSNVSLEQMLVALYRENKSAFVGNNMNRLRTGQILKVPAADEVAQIEQKEANREIRTQVADWKAYRENLAGGVASLPARGEGSTSSPSASSGRVASAAVTPPPPPAAESKDVLKLSKSDTKAAAAGAGAKGGGVSQDRFNAMQEELIAKDKALREAQSRVADLEKQIRDMQRLAELKAAAPAKPEAPKVAAAPTKEAPKTAEVKPEPAKEAPKTAEAAKAEAAKASEAAKTEAAKTEAAKITEAPKVAEAKPAEAKPAEAKPAEKAAPPKAAPKKGAPPPEKSFIDEMLDNPAYLALGGAAILGLGVGAFLFVRRRKARAEAGPSSSMTSAFPSDLKPSTGTGKAGGGLVDTGNSSFLTDFDKTGPGTIDTDEVDPVAEAEVYIAYGRDAQAEEILKEAMARDKNRPEIMLKLLEIYHARKSATAFEQVAKELHGAVGDSSPLWQKAAAMGAQIDPQNPLYAGAAATGTATFQAMAPAKPDVDFDLAGSSGGGEAAAPAPSFDLDLDKSTAAPTIDFEASQTPAPPDVPVEPAKEEKPSFDFDLSGLDTGTPKAAEPALSTPAKAGAQSAGMSLDLADLNLDSSAGGGSGTEAVGTKLELAKAYLEIGDKDGARDILQEVAKEGSAAQQEEAKKLIASL